MAFQRLGGGKSFSLFPRPTLSRASSQQPLRVEEPVEIGDISTAVLSLRSHGLRKFIRHHLYLVTAALSGISLTFVCFAFTRWLAAQIFICPPWALGCSPGKSAVWMYDHIGQVQGVVSSIYGAGVGLVAFATYRMAETTLWPLLVSNPMRLKDIEHFLSACRGSLASSIYSFWRANSVHHWVVLIVVALLASKLWWKV